MGNNEEQPAPENRTWIDDLIVESDRGCVLISQAILEERLGDLIEAYLFESPDTMKRFVTQLRESPANPIGSFKYSVDYAKRERLIEAPTAKLLLEINAMRVKCAHYKPPRHMKITWKDANGIISLLSKNQRFRTRFIGGLYQIRMLNAKHSKARRVFEAIVFGLVSELSVHADRIVDPQSSD